MLSQTFYQLINQLITFLAKQWEVDQSPPKGLMNKEFYVLMQKIVEPIGQMSHPFYVVSIMRTNIYGVVEVPIG